MGDKTKIEWTDATWNPIRGCTRVSEGCRHCYAEGIAARFNKPGQAYEGLAIMKEGDARWTGKIRFVEEHLEDPLRWKRPRRIFVNSMSDLFHEGVDENWITAIFDVMIRSLRTTPHVFQILTKRPWRMRDYCRKIWPLHEVRAIQLGVSVEDQKTVEERIPILLSTPAAVRWVSYEPALGPIDLTAIQRHHAEGFCRPLDGRFNRIDWVVCGGESGYGARPMHPEWARSVRDQCVTAGVPFLFKQWGNWIPGAGNGFTQWPEIDTSRPLLMPEHPGREGWDRHQIMLHVRKKKRAGRLLDGREWNEYPKG